MDLGDVAGNLREDRRLLKSFDLPGLGGVRLSFSPTMRHLQFWSQPGRDFVCLEPFYGPNDTVNTDRRMDIGAGQARDFWMRIEREP